MRRSMMALVLFGAAALATNGLTADEKKADEKKDTKALTRKEIAARMKEVHRGEKSAHVRVELELKKDTPDWDEIVRGAKTFTEMGEAFKGADVSYLAPDKYIASTKALTKAASEKDKKAADEAFIGLTKSCHSCHCYVNPLGGRQ